MIGNALNMALDGVRLGSDTVYNFVDYIGQMHITGGVVRYSNARGYLYNNISNNREGGMIGRYKYGTIGENEKIYGSDWKKLSYRGEGLENAYTYQDLIGDTYGLPEYVNSANLKFVTEEEFDRLNELLMYRNLENNVSSNAFYDRYLDSNAEAFVANGVDKTEIGQLASQVTEKKGVAEDIFGDRLPIDENPESYEARENLLKHNYSEDDFKGRYNIDGIEQSLVAGNILTSEVGSKVKLDYKNSAIFRKLFGDKSVIRIDSIDYLNNLLSFYRINRNVAESAKSKPQIYKNDLSSKIYKYYSTEIGEDYDKLDKKSDILNNFKSFQNSYNGILEYYGNEIKNSTSAHTSYTFSRSNGHWVSSYGFPNNDLNTEIYSVDSKYTREGDIAVDPLFKDGTMIRKTPRDNTEYYNYYQETEYGVPATGFNAVNAPNNTTVGIGTFENGRNILTRTNELFRNNKIGSLINRFHTAHVEGDETLTSFTDNFGISRGRNLVKKQYEHSERGDGKSGFDNPYCRVWTAHHQYSRLGDRIRPFLDENGKADIGTFQEKFGEDMRPNNGARRLSNNSVLQDNGYLRITPYNSDYEESSGYDAEKRKDLRPYMFSLENLAWKGYTNNLNPSQIGPNGGRIMWFPPYNLTFNENVSTQWRDNEFIGRGEKIYTYANTERSGNLSFTILVDHPSIINKWTRTGGGVNEDDETERDLLRFFAGCGDLDVSEGSVITNNEDNNNKEDEDNKKKKDRDLKNLRSSIRIGYVMFFPNDFSASGYKNKPQEAIDKIDQYEMSSDSGTAFTERDRPYKNEILADRNNYNWSLYSLNTKQGLAENLDEVKNVLGLNDIDVVMSYQELLDIAKHINYYDNTINAETLFGDIFSDPSCKFDKEYYEIKRIEVAGFASSHGYRSNNEILCSNRADLIGNIAKYKSAAVEDKLIRKVNGRIVPMGDEEHKDVNSFNAKVARSAKIVFEIGLKDDVKPYSEEGVREDEEGKTITSVFERYDDVPNSGGEIEPAITVAYSKTKKNFDYQNEFLYFDKIEENAPLVYENIIKKVKHFDPAFHSITPEGFNARLTFLHQCTRQGPTIGSHNGTTLIEGDGKNGDDYKFLKNAANLAFGTAPYCVLRIGDFFNSKICINSLSITYDNDGIHWDLNPEGIGVQPMMAKVDISFTFLGGQDIGGVINKLQNAISENYYANTSIYSKNAEQNNG